MPSVIDDLHAGKIIVLVDDEDRENEGNLVCSKGFNLVHSSDSAKSAEYEIPLFFKPEELLEYGFADEHWLYGKNE